MNGKYVETIHYLVQPDDPTQISVNKLDKLQFVIYILIYIYIFFLKLLHFVQKFVGFVHQFGIEAHSFHDRKKEEKKTGRFKKGNETYSTPAL